MKPEMLAVRAVNQYRGRDIIAYLGLRYYLDNECSRKDVWSEGIASHLVQTRKSPVYFKSGHFKEVSKDGSIINRNMYLPGPNEIMAESYLLNYCSNQLAFQSSNCVYSYRFPGKSSNEGIFVNYFPGFRDRNKFIKEICNERPEDKTKILFTDIKKFYPSISYELALESWIKSCQNSHVPIKIRSLGEKILSDHKAFSDICQDSTGLLTGPMFSHLIANLVLSDLDKFMSANVIPIKNEVEHNLG